MTGETFQANLDADQMAAVTPNSMAIEANSMSSREEETLKRWKSDSPRLNVLLSGDGVLCNGSGILKSLSEDMFRIDCTGVDLLVSLKDAQCSYSDVAEAPKVIRKEIIEEYVCQLELNLRNGMTCLLTERRLKA